MLKSDLFTVAPMNARFVWGEKAPMPLYEDRSGIVDAPKAEVKAAVAPQTGLETFLARPRGLKLNPGA